MVGYAYQRYTIMKKAEYKVVVSEDGFKGLEKQVNKLMNQGWKPLGGIAFNAGYPHQAMARIVEVKENMPTPSLQKQSTKQEAMSTGDAMKMIEDGI